MRAVGLVALYIAAGCASAGLTYTAIAQPRPPHTGTERPPPAPVYSKAEIDQKIDQLRSDMLSTVPSRQELQESLAQILLEIRG